MHPTSNATSNSSPTDYTRASRTGGTDSLT